MNFAQIFSSERDYQKNRMTKNLVNTMFFFYHGVFSQKNIVEPKSLLQYPHAPPAFGSLTG